MIGLYCQDCGKTLIILGFDMVDKFILKMVTYCPTCQQEGNLVLNMYEPYDEDDTPNLFLGGAS